NSWPSECGRVSSRRSSHSGAASRIGTSRSTSPARHSSYGPAERTVPSAYDDAEELADQIERRRAGAPLRPCHNDLLNANFIDDGVDLWLVDWEYAGMGDPLLDLGNFAVNHELTEDDERAPRRLRQWRPRRGRPDAVHVRFPRGDVGNRATRDFGARVRLWRLCGRALRATRADGGGAAFVSALQTT